MNELARDKISNLLYIILYYGNYFNIILWHFRTIVVCNYYREQIWILKSSKYNPCVAAFHLVSTADCYLPLVIGEYFRITVRSKSFSLGLNIWMSNLQRRHKLIKIVLTLLWRVICSDVFISTTCDTFILLLHTTKALRYIFVLIYESFSNLMLYRVHQIYLSNVTAFVLFIIFNFFF